MRTLDSVAGLDRRMEPHGWAQWTNGFGGSDRIAGTAGVWFCRPAEPKAIRSDASITAAELEWIPGKGADRSLPEVALGRQP